MKPETKTVGGLKFWAVGPLQLRRDASGKIQEYSHSLPDGVRGNPHAAGPFCYFSLPQAPDAAGVYAVFVSGKLKYIGECENLTGRFSATGYGRISPRNLHHDGQSTNCKLNSRVLSAAKDSNVTEIWFHPTNDRKTVESRLIAELDPEWNGRHSRPAPNFSNPATLKFSRPRAERRGAAAEEFRKTLLNLLQESEKGGASSAVVKAGDLHRVVGGYPGDNHRMPICCAVMRSFMRSGDRFLYQPPKGNGASLEIEYRLPRI